jgi:hypothetical protein
MRPTKLEVLSAALLVVILAGMVVVIVAATIPADGIPTLR